MVLQSSNRSIWVRTKPTNDYLLVVLYNPMSIWTTRVFRQKAGIAQIFSRRSMEEGRRRTRTWVKSSSAATRLN